MQPCLTWLLRRAENWLGALLVSDRTEEAEEEEEENVCNCFLKCRQEILKTEVEVVLEDSVHHVGSLATLLC